MDVPKIIEPDKKSSELKKAILKARKNEGDDIELMFNPEEISFTRSVTWESDKGNRGSQLLPKVNFSGVEPYKFTLKQLLFDTYESKESVMKHVNAIKKGVEKMDNSKADSRPPVYIFIWSDKYFHCVITSLTYKLNMFLTDGTPVRAIVDISLQEVDEAYSPLNKESKSKDKARTDSKPPPGTKKVAPPKKSGKSK
jgi:Contractile injection system tube protein